MEIILLVLVIIAVVIVKAGSANTAAINETNRLLSSQEKINQGWKWDEEEQEYIEPWLWEELYGEDDEK